jgi:hypothetical protein
MMDERPSAELPQEMERQPDLLLAAFSQAGQARAATPHTTAPVVTRQLLAAHLLQPWPAAIAYLQNNSSMHNQSLVCCTR